MFDIFYTDGVLVDVLFYFTLPITALGARLIRITLIIAQPFKKKINPYSFGGPYYRQGYPTSDRFMVWIDKCNNPNRRNMITHFCHYFEGGKVTSILMLACGWIITTHRKQWDNHLILPLFSSYFNYVGISGTKYL